MIPAGYDEHRQTALNAGVKLERAEGGPKCPFIPQIGGVASGEVRDKEGRRRKWLAPCLGSWNDRISDRRS
jgi:hypothetical protein